MGKRKTGPDKGARQPHPFDSPFCGRQKELEDLTRHLSQPASSGIVHITGEAGIGKSRLVFEALKALDINQSAIWWTGDAAMASMALYPAIRWIRDTMGLKHGATANQVKALISDYTTGRCLDPETDLRLLKYLLGVPEAVEEMRDTPPFSIQKNLFGLLRQILASYADKTTGCILIVDDTQWLDTLTKKFLSALADWPTETPLILILVYRPDAQPPIVPDEKQLVINLGPLSEEERHTLIQKLCKAEEFLPEIRKAVFSRETGSPLFLEEMMRIVQEVARNNAHLNGEALVNQVVEVIPLSLQELIQSRINRLDSRSRLALQCASILGLEFTFGMIEMFDVIRDGLSGHLQALRTMKYLREQPESGGVRYSFIHGMFRDVVYSTISDEQKRRLHASLARRIEEVCADRLTEHYELLAFHFSKGGEAQKAAEYLGRAAERQTGLGDESHAAQNFAEAIELLRGLPASRSNQGLMAHLLLRAGSLHISLGNGDQAEEMIGGALELADSIADLKLAIEGRLEQATALIWRGRNDEAQAVLEDLLPEAKRLNMHHLECVALNALGVICWQKGDFENALLSFRNLAGLAGKIGLSQTEADAFNNAGLIYWRWGQHSQALKAYKRALPLRKKSGDSFGLCAVLLNVGIIQEQMGEIGAARKSYDRAHELAEKTGYARGLAAVESTLSNLERRVGTLAAAMEHAVLAVEYSRSAGDPNLEAIGEENIGMTREASGEHTEARRHHERALELAKEKQNLEREVSARMSLLEITLNEGNIRYEDEWECNELHQIIEMQKYSDHMPRLYRLKGQILDILNERNSRTAREFLELSRDIARNTGNALDERDALLALLAYAKKHKLFEESGIWEDELNRLMEGIA